MGKNLQSLLVFFSKESCSRTKITKNNKYQIKSEENKPKLKAKQPVKSMKRKKECSKKKEV